MLSIEKKVFSLKTEFLRYLLIAEVALILIQAIIGMYVNLYVIVPFPINFTAFVFSLQGAVFGFHHLFAILVLLFAAVILIFSFRINSPSLIKTSILGLVLLAVSYVGGTAFVFLQPNSFYSLIMAATAIAALVVYTSEIFSARA
jgi:hypothetical protein